MNQVTETWSEIEKQVYLSALAYILRTGHTKSVERKEFIKNKAREVGVPMGEIQKTKDFKALIKLINELDNIKTKRFIIRDMILLSLADHDLSDEEMKLIYEISSEIGIKSEKVDDFFLWAARGIEWQIEGSRLVDEDI